MGLRKLVMLISVTGSSHRAGQPPEYWFNKCSGGWLLLCHTLRKANGQLLKGFLKQTSWTIVNFARPISILWVNCIPSVHCVTLLSSYTVHLVHLIRTLGRRYAVMHNFGVAYDSSPWLLISTTSCYLVTPYQVPVGHVRMYSISNAMEFLLAFVSLVVCAWGFACNVLTFPARCLETADTSASAAPLRVRNSPVSLRMSTCPTERSVGSLWHLICKVFSLLT